MILKEAYLAKQVVDSYNDYEKDSAGIYSFTEWGWINTMMVNGGFLRVALGDAGLKVKGEGGINKRLSQYDNSKHLESDRVPIGQWVDPVGFKRDYDIQKDLDKIAKRLYFNDKAKELWEFAVPEQIRRDYLKSGLNPTKIVDYAYRKINEVISKKNPINIRNNVKLRKLQKVILVKMMKMLERHGIDSTLVAELADRKRSCRERV